MFAKAQLIQFKTTDRLELPGLLYEPQRKTKKVALVLHGNGSSSVFYSAHKHNLFAKILNKKGISYFPFNNRGAHYIKSFWRTKKNSRERVRMGTSYELIKDCIKDIDGAIKFLWQKNYRKFYVIGYSSGANKICVYDYYKPRNKVSAYILVGGGDDSGIYYDMIGGKTKFLKALKHSQAMIKKDKGLELIPKSWLGGYIFSYQSFYDIANPDGDYNTFPFNEYTNKLKLSKKKLFKEFKNLKKPTLVVYGEKDDCNCCSAVRVMSILKDQVKNQNNFSFKIIKNADHSINGYEKNLARLIASWI